MRRAALVNQLISLTASCLIFTTACTDVAAQGASEVIAQDGTTTPSGNGDLSFFGPPVLNNNGEAAFWNLLQNTNNPNTDDMAVFRASTTPGSLTEVAREGQSALGDGLFGSFELLGTVGAIGDAGHVAFRTDVTGTANNDGIFRGSGGAQTEIARRNDPAPTGNNFSNFGVLFTTVNDFASTAVNVSGQVTFWADDGNEDYIFRSSGGAITQVSNAIEDFWALHSSGNAAYRALGANEIFHGNGTTQTQIVELTQAAPDANGRFQDLLDVAVNGSGQVAFASFMDNFSAPGIGDKGVFRGSGGAITQIMRTGDPAPVGTGVIDDFNNSQPSINETGQVVFGARLRNTAGGADDDTAIYRGTGGALTQIVREDQPAPDGNGRFSSFNFSLDSGANFGYLAPTINSLGWVAFRAELRDTAGGTDDNEGVFISDGFDIVQVARRGQTFGNTVMTTTPAFVSIPNDGRSGFNDLGQLAYRVQTGNGKTFIALWTPPDAEWTNGSGQWSDANHWTQNIIPKSLFHTLLNPAGGGTINGDFGSEHVRSLTIGGGPDPVTFNMQPGSVLTVAGGLLAVMDNGVLTGGGTIEGTLANPDGEVLVSTGQQLTFTGVGNDNASRVTLTGGELRFVKDFTNNGTVIGTGTLRADGGIANNDTLAFSATTNVVGELTNDTNGLIVTSGGTTTFQDDVTNLGEIRTTGGSFSVFYGNVNMASNFTDTGTTIFQSGVSPGLSPGAVDFGGNVQLGPAVSVLIELQQPGNGPTPTAGDDYDQLNITSNITLDGIINVQRLSAYDPNYGDEFEILTWDSHTGMFDAINGLNISDEKTLGPVADTQGLTLFTVIPGDFNRNGEVSIGDLSILASHFGETTGIGSYHMGDANHDGIISIGDLSILAGNFGMTATSGPVSGLSMASAAALVGIDISSVPEPTSIILLAATPLLLNHRRRRP